MPTVSTLVKTVANLTGVPEKTVSVFARELLNAGLLPKSRGRAIAQVKPIHVLRLFLVLAISPKLADAAPALKRYGDLLDEDGDRVEDYLCQLITDRIANPSRGASPLIVVDHNHPNISVWEGGKSIALFDEDEVDWAASPPELFFVNTQISMKLFEMMPPEFGR